MSYLTAVVLLIIVLAVGSLWIALMMPYDDNGNGKHNGGRK